MWKCPNCETMNEDEELCCIICDTNRDSAAVPDIPKCDIKKEESKDTDKRSGDKIINIMGIVIVGLVILIICLMFLSEGL